MAWNDVARRGLRAALIPAVALATVLPASASTPTSLTDAQYGATFLADQLITGAGYVASPTGAPSQGDTAFADLAIHAAGVDRAGATRATRWLSTHLTFTLRVNGQDAPGPLALDILVATASGLNPRAFGGAFPTNDLVARLEATQRTTGTSAGLFGAQSATYDGATRQGLALAALASAGVPASDPHVVSGLAWLTGQQCSDGLWQAYRASTAKPCPSASTSTYLGPDTNSTAFAVMGLAAYGQHPNESATLAGLAAVRASDGGFAFMAVAGQPSDPNSTALVLQALEADQVDVTAAPWTQAGASPVTALESYQLGCSAPAAQQGGFTYPGTSGPNTLATVQAIAPLAGQAYPLSESTPTLTSPSMTCS